MSTVPKLDFTSTHLTCLQVYRFLCHEGFYNQAGDLNRRFRWDRVKIPVIKTFFYSNMMYRDKEFYGTGFLNKFVENNNIPLDTLVQIADI